MKKILCTVVLALIAACGVGLSACKEHVHTFGDWTVVLEPTCETAGEMERVCSGNNNHVEVTIIDALGHNWSKTGVVSMQPTCTAEGMQTVPCLREDCDEINIEVLPKLEHDYSTEWTEIEEPTCTEKGVDARVCKHDANHWTDEREGADALGHDYVWQVTKAATETEDGIYSQVCSRDGHIGEEKVIHAKGTAGLVFSLISGGNEYSVRANENGALEGITELYIPAFHSTDPNGIDGKPVTVVSTLGFSWSYCADLETIRIAEGIKRIEDRAFETCTGLVNLELPDSLTFIGQEAFKDCPNLVNIDFPQGAVSIKIRAFAGTGWYAAQADGVVYINSETVYSYKGELPADGTVDIADGVKIITDEAFIGLEELLVINIPDSVTTLGKDIFTWTGLTTLTLSNNITTIGVFPLFGIENLATIYFNGTQTQWETLRGELVPVDPKFPDGEKLWEIGIDDTVQVICSGEEI